MFRKQHSAAEPPESQVIDYARAEGTILEWATSATLRSRVRLTVGVKFDDGLVVEFAEEIAYYIMPPAGGLGPIAAMNQDPISLPLLVGNKIPIRYDPADRTRMSIDVPTLHETALRAHAEAMQARRAQADKLLAASDPVPSNPPVQDS